MSDLPPNLEQINGQMFELVSMCLYDTVHIQKVPLRTRYALFCMPVGCIDPNERLPGADYKTFLRTSQTMCGQLEMPVKFLASRINVLFIKNNRPLRIWETDLYCKTEICFTISQKIYWEGPAWQCASPFALFGIPFVEIPKLKEKYGVEWERVGGNLGVLTVERPFDDERRREYYEPLVIEPGQSFTVRAGVYDIGPHKNLQLAVCIDGVKRRPVI